jgi:hypothetical protein
VQTGVKRPDIQVERTENRQRRKSKLPVAPGESAKAVAEFQSFAAGKLR